MKYLVFILLFISTQSFTQQQKDSLPYTSYKYHPIVFTDFGYSSAPASIKYPFRNGINHIFYKHNNKMILGLGVSYRWFSLRIGAALIGNTKAVSKFGKSNYFDVGIRFSIKKTYSEFNFRYYTNYVIKNANQWDSTLNDANPNDKNQKIDVFNFGAQMWYLHNKNFRMDPFLGNRGAYKEQVMTWYLEGRLDVYGMSNKLGSLIPRQLQDTSNTKTTATGLSALELGVIPGFGYVNNINNFQFGFMVAAGPLIQFKTYAIYDATQSLGGIVGRYNAKVICGYNRPHFFAMFIFDIENKSLKFDELKYNQTFMSTKIQVGYRFKEKLPKKKRKKKRI